MQSERNGKPEIDLSEWFWYQSVTQVTFLSLDTAHNLTSSTQHFREDGEDSGELGGHHGVLLQETDLGCTQEALTWRNPVSALQSVIIDVANTNSTLSSLPSL